VSHPLEPRIAAYIAGKMPQASDVAVSALERISGGASRETYRFVLTWREDGAERTRRMILRRDPPASLIDTERRIEFEAYAAFHGSAVPVPQMLWLEEADEALDHPFFIAEELAGFQAAPQLLFSGPYDAVLPTVAERKWTILGEIARADPIALGLGNARLGIAHQQRRRLDQDRRDGRGHSLPITFNMARSWILSSHQAE